MRLTTAAMARFRRQIAREIVGLVIRYIVWFGNLKIATVGKMAR